MDRYVVRVDYTVLAESEDDAIARFARDEAHYDGVYEVEYDGAGPDEEDEDED